MLPFRFTHQCQGPDDAKTELLQQLVTQVSFLVKQQQEAKDEIKDLKQQIDVLTQTNATLRQQIPQPVPQLQYALPPSLPKPSADYEDLFCSDMIDPLFWS